MIPSVPNLIILKTNVDEENNRAKGRKRWTHRTPRRQNDPNPRILRLDIRQRGEEVRWRVVDAKAVERSVAGGVVVAVVYFH